MVPGAWDFGGSGLRLKLEDAFASATSEITPRALRNIKDHSFRLGKGHRQHTSYCDILLCAPLQEFTSTRPLDCLHQSRPSTDHPTQLRTPPTLRSRCATSNLPLSYFRRPPSPHPHPSLLAKTQPALLPPTPSPTSPIRLGLLPALHTSASTFSPSSAILPSSTIPLARAQHVMRTASLWTRSQWRRNVRLDA